MSLHFHTHFEDRSRTTVFEEKWNVFMMVEEIFLQYRRGMILHARRMMDSGWTGEWEGGLIPGGFRETKSATRDSLFSECALWSAQASPNTAAIHVQLLSISAFFKMQCYFFHRGHQQICCNLNHFVIELKEHIYIYIYVLFESKCIIAL